MLATAAGAYAVLLTAVWLFQAQLLYFPSVDRGNPATPASLRFAFESVRIPTPDGETLDAWYVPAPRARGAALFLHGNAGSIAHRLDWLPLFRELAFDTLLIDYRGYGKSTGRPSEEGTYADAQAAWDYLTRRRGFAPKRIAVFGESLGGAVAADLASRTAPGALILMSTFTSVPDLAAELYPWLPARALARFDYDTLGKLGAIASPVLIAHSRDDEIIPFRHGERLFEAANEPKVFLELAGGHNEGFIFVRRDWSERLGTFLDQFFPGDGLSGDGW